MSSGELGHACFAPATLLHGECCQVQHETSVHVLVLVATEALYFAKDRILHHGKVTRNSLQFVSVGLDS